jgi:hypothetical protein
MTTKDTKITKGPQADPTLRAAPILHEALGVLGVLGGSKQRLRRLKGV